MLSTRTKILYGNVFQVGSLSSKKASLFYWKVGEKKSAGASAKRSEECIRTVVGYELNETSCVSWRRLHIVWVIYNQKHIEFAEIHFWLIAFDARESFCISILSQPKTSV